MKKTGNALKILYILVTLTGIGYFVISYKTGTLVLWGYSEDITLNNGVFPRIINYAKDIYIVLLATYLLFTENKNYTMQKDWFYLFFAIFLGIVLAIVSGNGLLCVVGGIRAYLFSFVVYCYCWKNELVENFWTKFLKTVEIMILLQLVGVVIQAGLAGGSADGAAVIKAMNKLFHLNLSYEEMAALGKEVGADIPFCIYEKTAFVEGVGEKLQFIDEPFEAYLLLVKPKKGVSTQKAFTSLDLSKVKHQDCRKMKKGIEMNDYQAVIDNLQNTLELPSIKMVPQIKEIKKEMMKLGFDGALMSGSGSCVFGITRNQEIMNKGYEFFRKRYFFVRKSKILNKEENL